MNLYSGRRGFQSSVITGRTIGIKSERHSDLLPKPPILIKNSVSLEKAVECCTSAYNQALEATEASVVVGRVRMLESVKQKAL